MTRPSGQVDPAGHGAGRVGTFTVLYDAGCPNCRAAHRWLAARDQLVPLDFVPAGSAQAQRRFPGLDHPATLRDLTVIAESGLVYVSDAAWLACLWALTDYRGMADRLGSPRLLPAARRFITAASAVPQPARTDDSRTGDSRTGDYGDVRDDRCRSA
jgi:predicted DCC family thiol-disulfide oxidoreductase YuxK